MIFFFCPFYFLSKIFLLTWILVIENQKRYKSDIKKKKSYNVYIIYLHKPNLNMTHYVSAAVCDVSAQWRNGRGLGSVGVVSLDDCVSSSQF